jgi:hypothetical protein
MLQYAPICAINKYRYPQFHTVFLNHSIKNSLTMTSRKGRPKLSVYDIKEDLKSHRTIPIYHHQNLEERLTISFKELGRQPRTEVRRETKQILANSRKNKAHRIYLQVLEEDCRVFIPFLLAVSPGACASHSC